MPLEPWLIKDTCYICKASVIWDEFDPGFNRCEIIDENGECNGGEEEEVTLCDNCGSKAEDISISPLEMKF